MMKSEFEAMSGTKISKENYEMVETVYMYYPRIETKDQIVAIYKLGMVAINDLFPRAKELKEIEFKITELKNRANELNLK